MSLEVFGPGDLVTSQDYADRVTQRWQDSWAAIVDCGRWLVEAKAKLAHGDYGRLFADHADPLERPVPFGPSTARRLMAIAGHPVLGNRAHAHVLPPSWMTLYELSHLPAPALEAAIEAGEVRAEMERGDAFRLVKEHQRDALPPASRDVGATFAADLRGQGFEVYLGEFQHRLSHLSGGVDLVVTDPPYGDDDLELYGDLGDWASRALRPGGVAIVYAGTYRLPQVLERLGDRLEYRWTFCLDLRAGSQARFMSTNMLQRWKPIVVMYRPPWQSPPWGADVLVSPGPAKDAHPWQQNIAPVRELIERYSAPGWVVADPFLGAGTTGHAALQLGRTFIGCDVDPACVEGFRP